MPGIRKSAPDHRSSQLLVQEALVLLILCILCIDVQSVENHFNWTWHRLAIADTDPLFHSRMIRPAGRGLTYLKPQEKRNPRRTTKPPGRFANCHQGHDRLATDIPWICARSMRA